MPYTIYLIQAYFYLPSVDLYLKVINIISGSDSETNTIIIMHDSVEPYDILLFCQLVTPCFYEAVIKNLTQDLIKIGIIIIKIMRAAIHLIL